MKRLLRVPCIEKRLQVELGAGRAHGSGGGGEEAAATMQARGTGGSERGGQGSWWPVVRHWVRLPAHSLTDEVWG